MTRRARGRALIIVLGLLALGAAGGMVYRVVSGRGAEPAAPEEESYRLVLEDLTVNLADRETAHYLRMSVTVILRGVAPEEVAEAHAAEIRDAVITAASEHTYEDLLSTEGKEALKADIAEGVEGGCGEGQIAVTDVLFTGFIMD